MTYYIKDVHQDPDNPRNAKASVSTDKVVYLTVSAEIARGYHPMALAPWERNDAKAQDEASVVSVDWTRSALIAAYYRRVQEIEAQERIRVRLQRDTDALECVAGEVVRRYAAVSR